MNTEPRFLKIDEEGYPMTDEGHRLSDPEFTHPVFENLQRSGNVWTSQFQQQPIAIEAFDAPIVANQIEVKDGQWQIIAPTGYRENFELTKLSLDEWDRFHGLTASEKSFVMSRSAQSEFFNLLDDFDDETISFQGKRYRIPDWLVDNAEVIDDRFWSKRYAEQTIPWDQSGHHPAISSLLSRIKQTKSRILVPGCGRGHDAHFLAELGHIVHAVDISHEALGSAREQYRGHHNLDFEVFDFFQMQAKGQYDMIFEHTFFCAIPPSKRKAAVKKWHELLSPNGLLMGIFFVLDKRSGPPYGGSEWELRQRLKKNFDLVFWNRYRSSTEKRMGQELLVVARKKS